MVERTVTTTLSPRSTDRRFDLLSLGTFIILGLPDGMLGTAWPAMRQSFGVPVGDLGLILLVNTVGSVAVAAFVGRLIQRLGVRGLLRAAAGRMAGGLTTAVALTGRPRLLNLLHGFYGIGTAIGPLVVTAAILAGSWRPAYLLLVALDLAVAVLWALHHRRTPAPGVLRPPTGSGTSQSPDVTDPDVTDPDVTDPDVTDPDVTDPAATWSRRRLR